MALKMKIGFSLTASILEAQSAKHSSPNSLCLWPLASSALGLWASTFLHGFRQSC